MTQHVIACSPRGVPSLLGVVHPASGTSALALQAQFAVAAKYVAQCIPGRFFPRGVAQPLV